MDRTRPLCGECIHFQADASRIHVEVGSRRLWLRCGTCELTGGRLDRCRFCDDCPHFHRDRQKAESHGSSALGPDMIRLKRWERRPVMDMGTGKKYASAREAALDAGVGVSWMSEKVRKTAKEGRTVFSACKHVFKLI